MRRILVALLLMSVTLAGCAESEMEEFPDVGDALLDDSDAYYANHLCVKNDIEPRLYAPDHIRTSTPWEIGDFWTYRLNIDGEDLGTTRLVYYADGDVEQHHDGEIAQHYLIGTADEEDALTHAIFSTNPVVGRIHRLLYSPHESGAHADMFNFPLCDGNRWSTTFYDREFNMRVTQEPATTPKGIDPDAYKIVGTAQDGSRIEYRYSPDANWFTDLRLDRADGLEVLMSLTDFGDGATGNAYFYRGQSDEVIHLENWNRQTLLLEREHRNANDPYRYVGVHLDVGASASDRFFEVRLLDPAGNVVVCVGQDGSGLTPRTMDCPRTVEPAKYDFVAGDWRLEAQTSGFQPVQLDLDFRFVSILDQSGRVGSSSQQI